MRDGTSDGKPDKAALHWQKIETFLKTHDCIMNADVKVLCGGFGGNGKPDFIGAACRGETCEAAQKWALDI